jgi:poly(3-hydroxybutyrate) depolymerase
LAWSTLDCKSTLACAFQHRYLGLVRARMPIDGGLTDINHASLSDVMLKCHQMNRCTDPSTVSVSAPSTTTSWGCAQGSTVAMRVVAGGIHAWPGSLANGIVEPNVPDRSFDASSVIADFFQAHPRVAASS